MPYQSHKIFEIISITLFSVCPCVHLCEWVCATCLKPISHYNISKRISFTIKRFMVGKKVVALNDCRSLDWKQSMTYQKNNTHILTQIKNCKNKCNAISYIFIICKTTFVTNKQQIIKTHDMYFCICCTYDLTLWLECIIVFSNHLPTIFLISVILKLFCLFKCKAS